MGGNTNENPVPLWGTIMIGVAGGICLLCCLVCLCRNSCCKKKEKYSSGSGGRGGGFGYLDFDNQEPYSENKVQPDLEDLVTKKENYGRLRFSLEYDRSSEELEVHVIEASNLRGHGPLGSIANPYVTVYVSPDFKHVHETSVVHLSLNPVFKQKFVFKLPYSSRHGKILVLSVYHSVLLSKSEKLGQVRIPLTSYDLAEKVEECHAIQEPEEDEKDTNLGDICLSLRYVPIPGRLTVVVLEAKGLKEIPKEPKEYYIKLSLVLKKRSLKKRKTSTKESTCNPYYNESFTFDANMETMQKAYLRVTAAIPSRLGRKSNPVGFLQLGFGSQSSSLSYQHWNEILTHIGHPVVHWHALVPVTNH